MGEKGDAYEHHADMTGFGDEAPAPRADEHREPAIPPSTDRNEIDVKGRNRALPDPDEVRKPGHTHPHGPETHQDTRITRKSGE